VGLTERQDTLPLERQIKDALQAGVARVMGVHVCSQEEQRLLRPNHEMPARKSGKGTDSVQCLTAGPLYFMPLDDPRVGCSSLS
jgi:hypothetical protein